MSKYTRTAYVGPGEPSQSNTDIVTEIINQAGLSNLADGILPITSRHTEGSRKVRITITVETLVD